MCKSLHAKRYDLRKEPDGTWTVFDIFSGIPVSAGASIAFGMEEEFAEYLVHILNSDYRERRERQG